MPTYQGKNYKVILKLAQKQIAKWDNIFTGTLITDPLLKNMPGPDSVAPYQEGDDRADDPHAVLAWFADVRIDAGGPYVHDAIVPTQARANIGQAGSPVIVWRDPSTGAYQVVGRADRLTPIQSVKSYSTVALRVGFVRGQVSDGANVVSPFYQYTGDGNSVVTATRDGHNNAGLNRGIKSFDSGGNPVTSFSAGTSIEDVPYGELDYGSDPYGVLYDVVHNTDGSTTRTKR